MQESCVGEGKVTRKQDKKGKQDSCLLKLTTEPQSLGESTELILKGCPAPVWGQ